MTTPRAKVAALLTDNRGSGVRRILDNAAHRALAASPPTRAQEVTYTVAWVATTLTACALLALARWLSR